MARASPAAVRDEVPLALVETGSHGIRITAVNACAAAEGVRVGQALADARAALPGLVSRAAEPRRDRASLLKLARWCGRYGPGRNIDGADGVWIDITGVAHLYGGEACLIADLGARLARFNLTARAALADTLGAAHALARFAPQPATLVPPGATRAQLARLPVEALRLPPQTALLLRRLGLKYIGQLYALPRATLARRFRSSKTSSKTSSKAADAVLDRLDRALGVASEPLRALAEPPALYVQRPFADPLISHEGLEAETARLAHELCAVLDQRGLGARRVALSLYRADGTVAEARAGLSFPCRIPEHFTALLQEKLQHLDAGFGVDALVLAATHVERRKPEQTALSPRLDGPARGETAVLVDRLVNRLGADRVTRLHPRASHLPERAQVRVPAGNAPVPVAREDMPWPLAGRPPRPPLLLPVPEPIRVIAEVPEGAPARFVWRRVEHRVARAEGPERIAREWWREIGGRESRTRDYYRIEDADGAGYWVFRDGLYGAENAEPRWFLHGLYA
jgi:protein ImuB